MFELRISLENLEHLLSTLVALPNTHNYNPAVRLLVMDEELWVLISRQVSLDLCQKLLELLLLSLDHRSSLNFESNKRINASSYGYRIWLLTLFDLLLQLDILV